MIRNIIISILATILIGAFFFFIERYTSADVETKYFVHEIYMPSKVKIKSIKLKKPPKVKIAELSIENKTASQKIISHMKIFGLNIYHDHYIILSNASFNKEGETKGYFVKQNSGEYFLFEDELRIKQNGTITIYVWGDFGSSIYSTVKVEDKNQVFTEKALVSGIDKYFSNYWKYISILVLIIIILIIYVYQTKINKNI